MDVKNLPWKTITSIATTVVMTAATTLMNHYNQKKMIEDVGQKVGQEVVNAVQNQNEIAEV